MKRKFKYHGPIEFYADDLGHAEEILLRDLEDCEEDRPLTPDEIEDLKADDAYSRQEDFNNDNLQAS